MIRITTRKPSSPAPVAIHPRKRVYPLGPTQRHVLAWLRLKEAQDGFAERDAGEICRGVGGVTVYHVVALLGALEERGYVKRRGLPAKKALWRLTPEGWALP